MARPNTKPQEIKKTPAIVTRYKKMFDTTVDMINELKSLHSEIDKQIFNYDYDQFSGNINPKDLAYDVLKYASEHMPDLVNGKNIPVYVSVNKNRVILKTSKRFSIEWTFKFNNVTKSITDINVIVTTFTRETNPKELTDMVTKLRENNWLLEENE